MGGEVSHIEVRGARENNLVDVAIELPHGALIAFAGVSGSGKSSLAFDTLHQEGRRRYLEALAAGARGPAVDLRSPAVDSVRGLPPTVALDQRASAPDPRATVGAASEVLPLLGLLFARAGVQHCPACGAPIRPESHDEIVAALMALPEGSRLLLEAPLRSRSGGRGVLDEIGRAGFSRVRLDADVFPLEAIRPDQAEAATTIRVVVDRIRLGPQRRDRLNDAVRTTARAGHGVVVAVHDGGERVFVEQPVCWRDDVTLPPLTPRLFNPRSPSGRCPACEGRGEVDGAVCSACAGTRLRAEVGDVRFAGRALTGLLTRPIREVVAWLGAVEATPLTGALLAALDRRLEVLVELGLAHLELARGLDRLASGELQRLRLAGQVGAELSGVLYVLDEPAAGLHDREVDAVIAVLRRLVAAGNTVLVVEHNARVIAASDRVVEFGPGPGARGGRVIFDGTAEALRDADTATGRWLSGRAGLSSRERVPTGWATLDGARLGEARARVAPTTADLPGPEPGLRLPIGAIGALWGPSGSGKSTWLALAHAVAGDLDAFTRVITVDAHGGGRASRSTPATYVGAWDVVRELFAATTEAQVRGMNAGFFSLNKKGGRCEVCKGTGERQIALGWLPDVFLPCDVCGGRRFNDDLLEVRWKGRNADELLRMSAEEARVLLAGHPRLEDTLRALVDVGLGYVPLGQPGHTLSGGEAQRLRLARELARVRKGTGEGALYLLDDPTLGLHPADIAVLLDLLRRLTDEGATVWLATHDAALAAACDVAVALER